jgi:hypothetical protein
VRTNFGSDAPGGAAATLVLAQARYHQRGVAPSRARSVGASPGGSRRPDQRRAGSAVKSHKGRAPLQAPIAS